MTTCPKCKHEFDCHQCQVAKFEHMIQAAQDANLSLEDILELITQVNKERAKIEK